MLQPWTERCKRCEKSWTWSEVSSPTAAHLRDVVYARDGQTALAVGDGGSTLADAPRMVSPTKFHNSVHNASTGYWSIATGSHFAANAISAYADTVAASLLEGAVQAVEEDLPVLVALGLVERLADASLPVGALRMTEDELRVLVNVGEDERAFFVNETPRMGCQSVPGGTSRRAAGAPSWRFSG